MKNIVIGICSVVLIFGVVLTAYTLHGRSVRETELSNALSYGMEKAMGMLMAEGSVIPKSDEELVVCFLESFLMQIDSNSVVTVNVLDVDGEMGLLSVEAVLEYKHPIGTKGWVSQKMCILLEAYQVENS
ncbi:hypothetical protein FACS1894111_13020 [Clostridia bacterium]|nr:hypothetical protein FACS1894111_13020 [Clostridia bacterium]